MEYSTYTVQNNCYTIALDKAKIVDIVHRILSETSGYVDHV